MKTIKPAKGDAAIVRIPRSADLAASRQSYIGGTDLAPILGISDRRTRFAVWASKVRADVHEPSDTEEEAAAGTFYEPFILRRFGERFRVRVQPTPFTYLRRGSPFLGANPDGLVLSKKGPYAKLIGGVDAKTRSPFMRGLWGDAGTADVPTDELCQAQWYMEILDLPVWYLAVFFDRVLVVFVIPRDRELGALMVEEATAFWTDFVVPRKEPPFEGAAAADYLRRKFPHVTEPMKDATPDDDVLVARRILLKQHIAVLESRLDVVEGALKSRIAASSGLAGHGYIARWGERKAKTTVDWHAVVTELRSFPATADEETAAAVRAAIDAAIARYTKIGESSRALRVHFKGPRRLPEIELEPVTRAALPAVAEPEEETP